MQSAQRSEEGIDALQMIKNLDVSMSGCSDMKHRGSTNVHSDEILEDFKEDDYGMES